MIFYFNLDESFDFNLQKNSFRSTCCDSFYYGVLYRKHAMKNYEITVMPLTYIFIVPRRNTVSHFLWSCIVMRDRMPSAVYLKNASCVKRVFLVSLRQQNIELVLIVVFYQFILITCFAPYKTVFHFLLHANSSNEDPEVKERSKIFGLLADFWHLLGHI